MIVLQFKRRTKALQFDVRSKAIGLAKNAHPHTKVPHPIIITQFFTVMNIIWTRYELQWNLIITVTSGPSLAGSYIEVAFLLSGIQNHHN